MVMIDIIDDELIVNANLINPIIMGANDDTYIENRYKNETDDQFSNRVSKMFLSEIQPEEIALLLDIGMLNI